MKELQLKKEDAIIEKELRKFGQDLEKSRGKFCGPCGRRNIASSDDENFWKTSKSRDPKFRVRLSIIA